MVTPASVAAPRPAFTLVEVLVAVVVLGVGVLGAAATAALAARLLRQAVARDAAVAVAEVVLDSLARIRNPGPGERRAGTRTVRWTIDAAGRPAAIDLSVEWADGAAHRRLRLRTLHAPPPHRLGARP